MFKKTAIVAGLAMVVSAGAQADYRWQVDGGVGRSNIDVGRDDGDVDRVGLGGRFYFRNVDTSKGPLGEAAFLDQSSSVGAQWVYTDADDVVEDVDSDSYTIDGRYVLQTSIPLIFEASWSRETPAFSDIDFYRLGFGAYITDTTTLIVSYRTSDVDETSEIDPGDIDAYSIDLRHLWHLSGDGAVVVEGHYGLVDVEDNNINDGDDIDTWSIGGTWYINSMLGFGANFSRFDNFGIELDTYGVGAEWFVADNIGLSLDYNYSEIDDTDVEINAVVLAGELRF